MSTSPGHEDGARSGGRSLSTGESLDGLTPFQRELLGALIQRHPAWTTTEELAVIVGGGTTGQSIYSQIHQIRRRIEDIAPGAPSLIRTQRGLGYSLLPARPRYDDVRDSDA